jgi:hypothetical protein
MLPSKDKRSMGKAQEVKKKYMYTSADEIFRTRQNSPWDPSSRLCNGYRVILSGKAAEVRP